MSNNGDDQQQPAPAGDDTPTQVQAAEPQPTDGDTAVHEEQLQETPTEARPAEQEQTPEPTQQPAELPADHQDEEELQHEELMEDEAHDEDDHEGEAEHHEDSMNQNFIDVYNANQQEQDEDDSQQHQHYENEDDDEGLAYNDELDREGDEYIEGEDDMVRDQRQNAIMMEIYRIQHMVQETKQEWCDPDFPANDNSLYMDPLSPPEYSSDIPNVEWKRPHEIFTSDEPVMMKDPDAPGDVKQGILNDTWLLGTFSAMGLNPELLKNLIVHDGIKFGFAVFQFFKNGFWEFVTVDTRIPYNPTTKAPLYGHCAEPQEFWLPLIEKAYAKLHKSYEILNEGKISEALVDMTGGVSEVYDLKKPETAALLENGQFWKDIKKQYQQGFLVVCEHVEEDEYQKPVEGQGVKGIAFNKAYGVKRMHEFTDYSQVLQLLYIRNPWGPGQSVWQGAFSDEEESWDDYKGLRDRLDYQFKSDGNFWMRFEDWKANYSRVYLCKIFPSTWSQFSVASEWKGNTAGGSYPNLHVDPTKTAEEAKDQKDAQTLDTNDRWFNNPQFRLSVTKRTQVIISLMQEDFNISQRPIIPVNFLVVRVKSKRDRLWEIEGADRDNIIMEAAPGGSSTEQRELTRTLWLHPQHEKKDVHYIIIPNTELEGQKKEEERPFFLRVFASEQIELAQLPITHEIQFQNKWGVNSSGGKVGSPMWCRNPQYFMNITKPTHLKIILRKKGGRRQRGVPLGFTVTKANGPTVPPESTIKGKGKKGLTQPSSLITNGKTYAETLNTMNFKKEKGSDNIPEFELPSLSQNLQRKLQILDGEMCETTSYSSEDTAAMYAFYKPTQGPFVIVPSLLKDDKQADFSLTVFSSAPIQMEPLLEQMNVVLTGRWHEKNCGGSHLYDKEFQSNPDQQTWINNPKFILKLDHVGPVDVKITLSRPKGPWKKALGKNMVGSMIGFYVHENNPNDPPSRENVKNAEATKFVPWNEISETITLEGSGDSRYKEGYVIMPCTYESSKDIQGPFMIAVSTTVEFDFKQLE